MQNGIRKVVRRTNGIENPSTPSLKRIVSVSHTWLSISWNEAVPVSKRLHATSDRMKVSTVVASAAQRAFAFVASLSPRSVRMNAAPTNGRISRPERMPKPSINVPPGTDRR